MEGNVLFNDVLNTFYLRLYGVRYMVKDHSHSERGNSLPPHGLLFLISSKGYFICRQDNTYHSLCYTSRGALALLLFVVYSLCFSHIIRAYTFINHRLFDVVVLLASYMFPLATRDLLYVLYHRHKHWCTSLGTYYKHVVTTNNIVYNRYISDKYLFYITAHTGFLM